MTKLLISALALASSVLFTSLTADPALADRRVALVIGNAQYKNTSLSLPNPKNDADDVAATLRTLGFEVVLATNADKRALDQAMQQFARQVTRSEEHTSELQSQSNLVCRLLLEKKNPAAPVLPRARPGAHHHPAAVDHPGGGGGADLGVHLPAQLRSAQRYPEPDRRDDRARGVACEPGPGHARGDRHQHLARSEEHTSELQSQSNLVCR